MRAQENISLGASGFEATLASGQNAVASGASEPRMKNITTTKRNGAGTRAAKTSTTATKAGRLSDGQIRDWNELRFELWEKAASDRLNAASVSLTIKLGAHDYGMFTAAATVHKMTVEQVITEFLLERICDWSGENFAFIEERGEYDVEAMRLVEEDKKAAKRQGNHTNEKHSNEN
jgi:hypothetical protein